MSAARAPSRRVRTERAAPNMVSAYVLPARAEWALDRMSPALSREIRAALCGGSKRTDLVAPNTRDDDTQVMTALAMLDCDRALADYGVIPESVADMVRPEMLDLIARRVHDVIWEDVRLAMVLDSLREMYRYIHEENAPKWLTHRISHHLGAARRDQWDLMRTPAECIAAAVAAAGVADIMSAAGYEYHGALRLRDAALLAVAAEVNARRQEYRHLDIESVRFAVADGIETADLHIRKSTVKSRHARFGVVRDQTALALLRRLIGTRTTGPLFRSRSGGRLSAAGIAEAIKRTSLATLGVPLSPNLIRRGGVSDEEDEAAAARRIGDKHGNARTGTAIRYYSRSRALEGLALLRER